MRPVASCACLQVGWVASWSCHCPYVAQHGQHAWEQLLQGLRAELLQELTQQSQQPQRAEAQQAGAQQQGSVQHAEVQQAAAGSVSKPEDQGLLRTAIKIEVILAKDPVPLEPQ